MYVLKSDLVLKLYVLEFDLILRLYVLEADLILRLYVLPAEVDLVLSLYVLEADLSSVVSQSGSSFPGEREEERRGELWRAPWGDREDDQGRRCRVSVVTSR